MKKLLAAVLFVLMAVGVSPVVSAEEQTCKCPMACLHGLYIEPTLEGIIPFNDDLDAGFYGGGKIGYQLTDLISVEVDTGWSEFDIAEHGGTITMIPLLFNLRVNLVPGKYIVDPYVFGGIGISFNEIEGVVMPGSITDLDDSFAGQIGGGVEYAINQNLSAYLDVRFYFTEPDAKQAVLEEPSVDLNSVLIGGGIIWRF